LNEPHTRRKTTVPDEKKSAPKAEAKKSDESKSEEPKSKATPKGEKRRVAVYGTEREEFEHIYGKLEVDPRDARFVLVDAETEEKIRALPPGVPPTRGQDLEQVKRIKEFMEDADKQNEKKSD